MHCAMPPFRPCLSVKDPMLLDCLTEMYQTFDGFCSLHAPHPLFKISHYAIGGVEIKGLICFDESSLSEALCF